MVGLLLYESVLLSLENEKEDLQQSQSEILEKTISLAKKFKEPSNDARDKYGNTELCIACRDGHVEDAEILIKLGADVRAKCLHWYTPLHFVAEHGNVKIAQLLIQNGADVNVDADYEWTPLHEAASKGQLEVAKLLVKNGADVHAMNWFKEGPLHIAAGVGHPEIVKLLLKHGANKDLINIFKRTPLEEAEINKYGDFSNVEALLKQN